METELRITVFKYESRNQTTIRSIKLFIRNYVQRKTTFLTNRNSNSKVLFQKKAEMNKGKLNMVLRCFNVKKTLITYI